MTHKYKSNKTKQNTIMKALYRHMLKSLDSYFNKFIQYVSMVEFLGTFAVLNYRGQQTQFKVLTINLKVAVFVMM